MMQTICALCKKYRSFLLYLVVGGGATVVEWVFFHLFDEILGWNYILATALAFVVSTFANWALGRWLLFSKSGKSLLRELGQVYLTSVVGFFMNIGLMALFVSVFHIPDMIAKMIATGIVFFYNYFVRKKIIYKNTFRGK